MRNYLHILLLLLSFNLVAQTDDDCATALAAPANVDVGDILTLDNTGFSDEGNYTSSLLTGPISGFTAFIWDGVSGVYSINATSGAAGDWSVALNLDDGSGDECTVTASEELFTDILDSALPTEITCLYLVSGETYIIGFATDSGSEG
ncbi:hypothetical protein OAD00_02230, partial [Saprospiraceae bacterium]|nr:hypothetical protein [Saprospiraceae bacterium]